MNNKTKCSTRKYCLICGNGTTVWNKNLKKGKYRFYELWYRYQDGYACAACYQRGFKRPDQMYKRTKGVLDAQSRALILTTISDKNADATRDCFYTKSARVPLSDYIERTLALDKVFCFRCLEEIKIGQRYKRGSHSVGVKNSKFYHDSCYDKLWL